MLRFVLAILLSTFAVVDAALCPEALPSLAEEDGLALLQTSRPTGADTFGEVGQRLLDKHGGTHALLARGLHALDMLLYKHSTLHGEQASSIKVARRRLAYSMLNWQRVPWHERPLTDGSGRDMRPPSEVANVQVDAGRDLSIASIKAADKLIKSAHSLHDRVAEDAASVDILRPVDVSTESHEYDESVSDYDRKSISLWTTAITGLCCCFCLSFGCVLAQLNTKTEPHSTDYDPMIELQNVEEDTDEAAPEDGYDPQIESQNMDEDGDGAGIGEGTDGFGETSEAPEEGFFTDSAFAQIILSVHILIFTYLQSMQPEAEPVQNESHMSTQTGFKGFLITHYSTFDKAVGWIFLLDMLEGIFVCYVIADGPESKDRFKMFCKMIFSTESMFEIFVAITTFLNTLGIKIPLVLASLAGPIQKLLLLMGVISKRDMSEMAHATKEDALKQEVDDFEQETRKIDDYWDQFMFLVTMVSLAYDMYIAFGTPIHDSKAPVVAVEPWKTASGVYATMCAISGFLLIQSLTLAVEAYAGLGPPFDRNDVYQIFAAGMSFYDQVESGVPSSLGRVIKPLLTFYRKAKQRV